MTRKDIDDIVWWIPFKKLRGLVRDYFNNIISINELLKEMRTYYTLNKFLLKEIKICNYNDSIFIDILTLLEKLDFSGVFNRIYSLWFKHYSYYQLIYIFEFLEMYPNIWNIIDNKFWLIYISLLCENNSIDKALNLLKEYYNKFGFLDMHRFLFVSKLAKSLNLENECINKSVFIASRLDESIENNLFENIIKGKTVAVVGNGPQEIGKGNGKEIDSHDIVIRFNNFNLEGYEEDYGRKTDIWIINNSPYTNNINRIFNLLVCFEINFYRTLLSDHILSNIYNILDNKLYPISYFDYNAHFNHKVLSNVDYLTTGALALYFIKTINDTFSYKSVYGFSFINNDFDLYNYHFYKDCLDFETNKWGMYNNHNIDKEIIFLRKLFNL